MVFANTFAAPTLLVDTNGILTGAKGVDVGGRLLDVEFVDGTCQSVFSGCNQVSDFPPFFIDDAFNASRALLDQVLLNGPAGNFDSVVGLTRGCEGFALLCEIWTPFLQFSTPEFYGAINGDDSPGFFDDVDALDFVNSTLDTSLIPAVWAVWSESTSEPGVPGVPEPGTLALLALGGLVLVLTRRRRKS